MLKNPHRSSIEDELKTTPQCGLIYNYLYNKSKSEEEPDLL